MRSLIVALILAFSATASAQTTVQCKISGAFTPCTAPLLNTYVNWASPGAIGGGTASTVRGTTITAIGSLTTPLIASAASLTLDAALANTIAARVNSIAILTISATSVLASTKMIASPGTTTGDVLTWPVPAAAIPGWARTISGGIDSLIVSATRYAVPGQGPAATTDNAVDTVPLARTLQNLSCIALTNAGTVTVTVRRYNGTTWSSTGLTCVLTSSPLTCVDTTHTQVLTASDAVGFQAVTNGLYVGTKLQCSVEAVPS